MFAYDMNGLQLTPVAESLNAYRLTAVNTATKKYSAYAAGTRKSNQEFNMFNIGLYDDPRDAAFVAQEFEKAYDKSTIRQMVTDGTFAQVAKEFREAIEIPKWQYPAEGLSFDDILGGKYKTNYVDNAKDALVEALRVFGMKAPTLNVATKMMAEVEDLVKTGMTYRKAASVVVGG